MIGALVVLVKVPVVNDDATVPDTRPVIPAVVGALQLYVVPAGMMFVPVNVAAVSATLPGLHTGAGVWLTIDGFGFTTTLTVKVDPSQLPAADPPVGVTVYTTVIAALVVLVNAPVVNDEAPVPDPRPVIPSVVGALQL